MSGISPDQKTRWLQMIGFLGRQLPHNEAGAGARSPRRTESPPSEAASQTKHSDSDATSNKTGKKVNKDLYRRILDAIGKDRTKV